MDRLPEGLTWLQVALPKPNPDVARHLQRGYIRKHIDAAYNYAIEAPEFATPRLAQWFRQEKSLGSKDRRRVSDVVYDFIRHGKTLSRCGATTNTARIDAWLTHHEGVTLTAKPHLLCRLRRCTRLTHTVDFSMAKEMVCKRMC